jgi:hypothetical protein
VQCHFAGRPPCGVDHVFDETAHLADLPTHHVNGAARRFDIRCDPDDFDRREHRRKRLSELVS